jgi:hypothetical protein
VTRYQILEHPHEHGQAVEAVAHHIALFDHPPGTVAGDRGVHSPETEAKLTAAGVKRVAIPAAGKLSEDRQALEHTRPWRRGYRLQRGHRGENREPATRLWMAQKSLPRAGRDGAVAGPGGHRQQSPPYRSGDCQVKRNKKNSTGPHMYC